MSEPERTTKATIDGRPILGSAPFVWEFKTGTSPATAVCDLTPGDADELTRSGKATPLLLVIDDGQKESQIRNLYCIQRVPGPNEKIGRVLLADRRWFWKYGAIRLSCNVRRHMGRKRLTSRGAPPVAFPVTEDTEYAPWSLDNGIRWTAESAIRTVMREILKKERDEGAGGADFTFSGGGALESVPFENLVLNESADQALARLLGYLPDYAVTVDADGSARIYSRVGTNEVPAIESMGDEKVGGGHIELVSLNRLRPREIHCLFQPEVEVRFDFEEELSHTATLRREIAADEMLAENVLPVPDFTLAVGSRNCAQGTWISVSEALEAWGAVPVFGTLTNDKLRRMFCPVMDVWGAVRLAGDAQPNANWGARITALMVHWRRTFRISRRWMDRISQLNPYLVATIDQETGTRAPATAWSDYCALNSQRSLLADVAGKRDLSYALNYFNYPSNGEIGGSGTLAAPCRVSIVDRDQGIIRLEWLADELRLREMLMPGTISNNPGPDFDKVNIAFNALTRAFGAGEVPQMASGYKAIVLLSAVPAVPNSTEQLYRVKVRPSEVAAVSGLGPFDGPIMEVIVGHGLETARVAWLDSREDDIRRLFGILPGEAHISDLVINDDPGHAGDAGSLNAISQAIAARIWAGYADRNQGQARFGNVLHPLVGLMDSLSLEVATTGEVSSTLQTGRQGVAVNIFSLMPPDVRNLVMKLAQAGK